MIRRLKAGEIIRVGDFWTLSDNPNGERIPVDKRSIGDEFIGDYLEWYPIFREISDNNVISINRARLNERLV